MITRPSVLSATAPLRYRCTKTLLNSQYNLKRKGKTVKKKKPISIVIVGPATGVCNVKLSAIVDGVTKAVPETVGALREVVRVCVVG